MRKDKHEWLEEKCTEVEEINRRHNTSGVYKTIKEITGKRGMRQTGIKDKYGKILTDGEQVLKRWKTHTETMYSQPEDQSDRRFLHRKTEDEPTPLVEEVREAMKKLKIKNHQDVMEFRQNFGKLREKVESD